jgi:AcrR family transcriptional regulator
VSPRQAPPPAVSREPAGLDADTVVAAALALVDDVGVGGFTMRGLAERLGVRAPTIYWHVGSKEAVFEAIVDRVVIGIAEESAADGRGDWESRLRRFLTTAHARLLAHPGVLELMRSVHSRALERWSTVALGIMRDAGFDDDAAPAYARVALQQAIGAAQSEAALRGTPYLEVVPGSRGRRMRVKPSVLRAGLDPHVAAMTSFDLDDQRQITHEIFVAGVRAAAGRAAT